MTEEKHNEIMKNIMKQLEDKELNLADAISVWHSLGLFLFSNLDKENKELSKLYSQMQEYLVEMQNMQNNKA
jgi:hypothetical protein